MFWANVLDCFLVEDLIGILHVCLYMSLDTAALLPARLPISLSIILFFLLSKSKKDVA